MTTKPKASIYNWRRKRRSAGTEEARADAISRIRKATQPAEAANDPQPGTEIDAIKREGLTGRQLRMARRMAQKHNLPATSDYDAVRLLRERGIEPFKRPNLLELVVPRDDEAPDQDRLSAKWSI